MTDPPKKKERKGTFLQDGMSSAKKVFGQQKNKPKDTIIEEKKEEPPNLDLILNDEQKEELFRETINMILDANRIYQKRTASMHREILRLEEVHNNLYTLFSLYDN